MAPTPINPNDFDPMQKLLEEHFDGSWQKLADAIDAAQHTLIQIMPSSLDSGRPLQIANAHHTMQLVKKAAQKAAKINA